MTRGSSSTPATLQSANRSGTHRQRPLEEATHRRTNLYPPRWCLVSARPTHSAPSAADPWTSPGLVTQDRADLSALPQQSHQSAPYSLHCSTCARDASRRAPPSGADSRTDARYRVTDSSSRSRRKLPHTASASALQSLTALTGSGSPSAFIDPFLSHRTPFLCHRNPFKAHRPLDRHHMSS